VAARIKDRFEKNILTLSKGDSSRLSKSLGEKKKKRGLYARKLHVYAVGASGLNETVKN